MDYQKIITAFELHDPNTIENCFKNGINPNDDYNGHALIFQLINMYSRGPLFKECIRVFVDNGLQFGDQVLLAVLLNDANMLDKQLKNNPNAIIKKYTLNCTFTPLYKASLLHICAEYNHLACAQILIKYGANINAESGKDENGFGGQTPIFHTVNQHNNVCMDVLKYLINLNADLDVNIKGLIWGQGYEWETYIPTVNPISYAMMGLLRQFQRTEAQIYEVVSLLMKAKYDFDYLPKNIPNKYLNS